MQFFNFYNSATYHFFQWVCNSGRVDVESLVRGAFGLVEGDPWFEILDVSTIAQDKLAGLLERILDDVIAEELPGYMGIEVSSADAHRTGDYEGDAYKNEFALFIPTLREALDDICFNVVAQAILMREKKWAPDKTFPEFFPLPGEKPEGGEATDDED